ncbi:MAG: phosphotransferase family protein [Steroidobacteraceae bacterium]
MRDDDDSVSDGHDVFAPDMCHVLTALRREMRRRFTSELRDPQSIVLLDMVDKVLEQLSSHYTLRVTGTEAKLRFQLEQLQTLASIIDAGDVLAEAQEIESQGVVAGRSDSTVLHHERWILNMLESTLSRTIDSLRTMSVPQQQAARATIGRLLQAEAQFLNALPEFGLKLVQPVAADAEEDRAQERDEAEAKLDPARVEAYLNSRVTHGPVRLSDIRSTMSGFSKETYIVRFSTRDQGDDVVVIRRDPPVAGSVEGCAADELPLLKALFQAGIPVPEPLWAEHDPDILGRPFIAVRFVRGDTVVDARGRWIDNDPARAKLLAKILAQIHRLDLAQLPLPADALALSLRAHVVREIDRFESIWKRRRLSHSSTMSVAFAWMRRNVPTGSGQPSLVHGDGSLKNMLVHEGRVSAMLDWELWHIGDPAEDLSYCRKEVERLMPWSEFLAHYYSHGGRPYNEQAGAFYEMWYQLRNGTMAMNIMWDFNSTAVSDNLRGLRQLFVGYPYYRHHMALLCEQLMQPNKLGESRPIE